MQYPGPQEVVELRTISLKRARVAANTDPPVGKRVILSYRGRHRRLPSANPVETRTRRAKRASAALLVRKRRSASTDTITAVNLKMNMYVHMHLHDRGILITITTITHVTLSCRPLRAIVSRSSSIMGPNHRLQSLEE